MVRWGLRESGNYGHLVLFVLVFFGYPIKISCFRCYCLNGLHSSLALYSIRDGNLYPYIGDHPKWMGNTH